MNLMPHAVAVVEGATAWVWASLLLKITLALAAALLLDRALRRRAALAGATMWNACLLTVALLPAAYLLLPAGRFAAESPARAAAVELVSLPESPPATCPAPEGPAVETGNSLPAMSVESSPRVAAAAPVDVDGPLMAAPDAVGAPLAENTTLPFSTQTLAATFACVYGAGVAVALFRLFVALWAVRRLRRTTLPLNDADWQRRFAGWLRCFGLTGRVTLRQSATASVPLVLGRRRPMVVVPADVATSGELSVRDAILVHELAHVVRGDYSWQLLQRGIEAMLWFHPLVWLAGRRIEFVRERVCDEFAVHHLGGAESYVDTLLAMASRLTRRPTVSLGLAVLRSSHLGERLAAMRDSSGQERCQLGRGVRLVAAACAILLAGWFGRAAVADPALPRAPGLTADAQELLNQYEAEANRLRTEAERKITEKRAALQAQLRTLQTHYTREDNLDAAVAIRDQIRLLHGAEQSISILSDPGSMTSYKDQIGKSFYIHLTGSAAGSVWGTDVYTHDSNLAAAAVHAGALSLGQTAVVKATLVQGPTLYSGCVRHGITSYDWNNSGGYYTGVRLEPAPADVIQSARVRSVALRYTGHTVLPSPTAEPVQPDPGTLTGYRHAVGQSFNFSVVGESDNSSTIWGDGIYTDDSPLATVAVHAGLLQPGQRGIVRVSILPPQQSFAASSRHGVNSYSWGFHGGSYSVQLVSLKRGPEEPAWRLHNYRTVSPAPMPVGSSALTSFRDLVGQKVLMQIVGSTSGSVWGTDVYTDDSSVESAAVHAGALKDGESGLIEITILHGQANYEASTRNGVTSYMWGQWGGSFRVSRVRLEEGRVLQTYPPVMATQRLSSGNHAYTRKVVGATTGSVWGSDTYASDSAIETAAVHAGILKDGEEGLVVVTPLPGHESYEGSTRHGVTSRPWGSWDGSFRLSKPGPAYGGMFIDVPGLPAERERDQ